MDVSVVMIAGRDHRPPYAVHVNAVRLRVFVCPCVPCAPWNIKQSFESCDGSGDT
jgi:hypothetical protein